MAVERKVSPFVENTSSLHLVTQERIVEQTSWDNISNNFKARFQINRQNLTCMLPEPVEIPVEIDSQETVTKRINLGWHSDDMLIKYAERVNHAYEQLGLETADEKNAFDAYCDEYFKDGIFFEREGSDHLGTDHLA